MGESRQINSQEGVRLTAHAFSKDDCLRFGASEGAWSSVTDTEANHDRAVTLAGPEKSLVVNYFGATKIFRGLSGNPKGIKRFYSDDGTPLDLKLTYPKAGKGEVRLYFTNSTLTPAPNDVMYFYKKSNLLHVGWMSDAAWKAGGSVDNDDAAYQAEIEEAIAGMSRKARKITGYVRDPKVAASVLKKATGCALTKSHMCFVSRLTAKPFLEAHHAVPVGATPRFKGKNLDRADNIIPLCPNCHRQIHHGTFTDVRAMLKRIAGLRPKLLARLGIDLQGLTECYGIPHP